MGNFETKIIIKIKNNKEENEKLLNLIDDLKSKYPELDINFDSTKNTLELNSDPNGPRTDKP